MNNHENLRARFNSLCLCSMAIVILALGSSGLYAQSVDKLKDDTETPDDILTYGMGYRQQRYSLLELQQCINVLIDKAVQDGTLNKLAQQSGLHYALPDKPWIQLRFNFATAFSAR